MSDLNQLKSNYEAISNSFDTGNLSMIEIADKYINEKDSYKKDCYAAKLIVYCWPALERLYFKQNVKVMTVNDCYDIFMDSFFYVMEKCVWKNPDNMLYNDKDAVLKAMYVLTESRRRNYFVAQNRQKRVINQYPISLESLYEDFQDGYFTPVEERYNYYDGWEKDFIKSLWSKKQYISAVVLDTILTSEVFDEDFNFDIKKLKKCVKNFDIVCYDIFIKKYDLELNYDIFHKYIENINDTTLYNYIRTALLSFKTNGVLKEILENAH